MYSNEKKNEVLSSRKASMVLKSKETSKKPVNWEIIEITRLADQAGYGASYGKFVQKTGR